MINHRKNSNQTGKSLRKIRMRKGLMQIDVAVATDLNRTYISRIETGKARVTFDMMCLLIKGLEITADELIEDNVLNFVRNIIYSVGGDKNEMG